MSDPGRTPRNATKHALLLLAAVSLLPPLASAAALLWGAAHGFIGRALRDGVDFWAGGFLAVHHRLGLLFAPTLYRHFLALRFGPLPPHIWSYPPNYLLLAAGFGRLAPAPAVFAFDAASLLLLVLVLRLARLRPLLIAAVALSPASLESLLAGQNGLLLAALIAGGLLLAARRPRLGGFLIGLATIKPQLGIPLPFYLIRRRRQAFVAAVLAAALLLLLSLWCFGPAPWIAFWRITRPAMQTVLFTGEPREFAAGLISVFAAARPFSIPLALALQAAVSLAAAAWATRTENPPAVLILCALASPYLHGYDLTGVALATALLVENRLEAGFLPGEPVLLFLAWAGPGWLVWLPGLAHLAPVLLILLLVCVERRRHSAAPAATPLPARQLAV